NPPFILSHEPRRLYRNGDGAGTASLLDGLPADIQDRPITVTYKYLSQHLTNAEKSYNIVKGRKSCVGEHHGKKMRVHKCPSLPDEEFNSEDDAEMQERVRRRARRRSEDDEDYTEQIWQSGQGTCRKH
ncbi:MAG: hypothetical protein M1839_000474, partial [Geoglossum umbratile]